MLTLKHINGSMKYGLLEKKSYVVGRSDADINLADSSVSRNHARLVVKQKKLYLQDLGSSNGTTVNSIVLAANQLFNIPVGCQIQFGAESTFILQEELMIFCVSSLGDEEIQELRQLRRFFHGEIASSWSPRVTHLIVPNMVLTKKLACALICKQNIIDIGYLKSKKQKIQQNQPLLNDSENLLKVYHGMTKELADIDLTIDRSRLFANKLFIFADAEQAEKTHDVIKLAGGYIKPDLHGDGPPLLTDGSYERILVQNDGARNPSGTYVQMEEHYSRVQRQPITVLDIIMAVVTGRIETYLETSIHCRGRDQGQCPSAAIAISTQSQCAKSAHLPHCTVAETPELYAANIRKRQSKDRICPSPKRDNRDVHFGPSDVTVHESSETMGDQEMSCLSSQLDGEAITSIGMDPQPVTAVQISRRSKLQTSTVVEGSPKGKLSLSNRMIHKRGERVKTIGKKTGEGEPSTGHKRSKTTRSKKISEENANISDRSMRIGDLSVATEDARRIHMRHRFNLKRTKVAEEPSSNPGCINVRNDLMPSKSEGSLQSNVPSNRPKKRTTNSLVQRVPNDRPLEVAFLHEPCVVLDLPKYFQSTKRPHETCEESAQAAVVTFRKRKNQRLPPLNKFKKQSLPPNTAKRTFRLGPSRLIEQEDEGRNH